jgi:transcriptional regulator NrdR family protein
MPRTPTDEKTGGMKCAECGSFALGVTDSRPAKFMNLDVVRRRRECRDCKSRATSIEIPAVMIRALEQEIRRSEIEKLRAVIAQQLEGL